MVPPVGPLTVTLTVAVALPAWPSETVYLKVSVAVWPAGSDANWPLGL